MSQKKEYHQSRGASLVELMVVVAILGVLTVAGRTVYKRHMFNVYRAEAKMNLTRLKTLQEEHYSRTGSYSIFVGYGKGACPQPPGAAAIGFSVNCLKTKYVYSCDTAYIGTMACVAWAYHDWIYPGCVPQHGFGSTTDQWVLDFQEGFIKIWSPHHDSAYQCL